MSRNAQASLRDANGRVARGPGLERPGYHQSPLRGEPLAACVCAADRPEPRFPVLTEPTVGADAIGITIGGRHSRPDFTDLRFAYQSAGDPTARK